jgi:predicted ATPase/5S rRNA maturation endonuclease (ribonuclease M5)
MKHSYFEIKNFKGINHVRLDFEAHPRSNIYTLVGLNESGKTTILEAINTLTHTTETLGPLNLPGYTQSDAHDLIPISKRSNFNDTISIKAGYKIEEEDNKRIREYLKRYHDFELTRDVADFEIEQTYTFKNSQLIEGQPLNTWSVEFWGKRKRARRESQLVGEDWKTALSAVRKLLPTVLYFPNFLFEFPDKIYLEGEPTDQAKHSFYRLILQDVLDAIGDNTSLSTHVLARAKAGGRYDRQSLESVLLNMGGNITETVFSNWNRIFKRKVGSKEIVVSYDRDDVGWYIQLRLKDANELYSISERSLGFRWFFTFLLLTQYRGFRKGESRNVLFLLDEPASNLHPSAQTQLLESFGRFPKNCSIIYTTHSHHMINPEWLEGTFVVKNEGLDYEAEDDTYNAKKTVITLQKYREFAAQHPDQSTYFQPVLDVLDYSPGKLENVPNVIMVEGKNDFYTLKYFFEKILTPSKSLNLMPGGGAGSLDNVIRIYLGWGRQFIVLLDSDKEGTNQKDRYVDLFGGLLNERVFTIHDANHSWKKELEYLITETDRLQIQQAAYPTATRFNKTHFNRAIQELYLTDHRLSLSPATLNNFEKLCEFCAEKLRV